jgi:beta-galactosidase
MNRLIYTLSSCAAIYAASTPAVQAQLGVREKVLFTDGWKFSKGDPTGTSADLSYGTLKPWLLPTANPLLSGQDHARPAGAAPGEALAVTSSGFDDASWRSVTLPHDWGAEGPFDINLPGETGKLPWHGVAWYRKTFDLPVKDAGKQVTLQLDGAMSYSAVWCNGKLVGGWPYGYASYEVDLTPYLKPGGKNTIAVRIDNPEESSRWYPGGGIYRNVWLNKTSAVHVAHWGTYVTTPEVSKASATVQVEAELKNATKNAAQVKAAVQLFNVDADGKPVGKPLVTLPSVALTIQANSSSKQSFKLKLPNPKLWSTETPNQYAAVVMVQANGNLVDRHVTPFGVRTLQFTANDGFLLNGVRVPIKGVCLHHDLGALGAAFNVRAAERQLQIMKEMGCNAIRTAHNPPAPELLDLCDRMGLLVMDEFSDTWSQPKKPNGYARLFADWSEADVRAMVRRDRNHPSIIMWSIGNEVPEQLSKEGPEMGKKLTAIVKSEDATRPTSGGCHRIEAGYNGFQDGMDILGYNYKPWEYGKFHKTHPNQPLLASETSSCISSRGEYLFPVSNKIGEGQIGYQVSSYDLYAPGWAMPPDTEFKGQEQNPFVLGEFVWTGFDYIGEPTPFNDDMTVVANFPTEEERKKAEEELKQIGKIKPPSRSSYFGIVDLAGFKKDRFYLYQAHWRPELPMAHILPHWNWADRVGQVTPVHVYTSGDEAELFLNGKSLGRKKKDKLQYRLRWDDVKYEPGELKVVAYKDGKEWATSTVKTTAEASQLKLTPDRDVIKGDGRDLSFVTCAVADKEGLTVPQAKTAIKFSIEGPGEIVATDNGDATDLTAFPSQERKSFNGLALAIVKAKPGATGVITVKATADGLTLGETKIKTDD